MMNQGRAIAQAVSRPASHRGGPGSSPGEVMWDLWWTQWHCGRFFPSTSVSPANFHSTDCFTLIIISHPGPTYQVDSASHHPKKLKKKNLIKKELKGISGGSVETLSRDSPKGTKKHNEQSQPVYPPRFKPRISRIRLQSLTSPSACMAFPFIRR
jgi:hypothetical protein